MMINEFISYLAFPYLAMVVLIHIAMFLKCATHRRIKANYTINVLEQYTIKPTTP